MKALTIHQPYAWAVAAGIKRVENRSRPTAYRGPLLIHAGLSRRSLGREDDWNPEVMRDMPRFADLPFGAVVGVADVVACLTVEQAEAWAARECPGQDEFAEGPWCWLLANARPLAEPVPLRGKLGLFAVPDSLISHLPPAPPPPPPRRGS